MLYKDRKIYVSDIMCYLEVVIIFLKMSENTWIRPSWVGEGGLSGSSPNH